MFFIYKITNITNDKIYIGQTNNPNLRWSQHKSNAKYKRGNQVITRAITKYGVNSFKFEIISNYKSQEEVNLAEEEFIKQYDSRNPDKGYNVDVGGFVEPRPAGIGEKISQALKKYYETNESKAKGRKHTEEARKKMSEIAIGKPGTNEGKKFNDEWKLKISKAQTGVAHKRARRFSEEVEKEICRLYVEEGKSAYWLGNMYSCNRNMIPEILRRNGFEVKKSIYNKDRRVNGCNKFTIEQELEICKMYSVGNISIKDLSIQYKCGRTTIRDILIRNGILFNDKNNYNT